MRQDILNLRKFGEALGAEYWQLVGRAVRMLSPDEPELLRIVRENAGEQAVATFQRRCRAAFPHTRVEGDVEQPYMNAFVFEPDHLYYTHRKFVEKQLGEHVSKVRLP